MVYACEPCAFLRGRCWRSDVDRGGVWPVGPCVIMGSKVAAISALAGFMVACTVVKRSVQGCRHLLHSGCVVVGRVLGEFTGRAECYSEGSAYWILLLYFTHRACCCIHFHEHGAGMLVEYTYSQTKITMAVVAGRHALGGRLSLVSSGSTGGMLS